MSRPTDSRAIKKPQAGNPNLHFFKCEVGHISSNCRKAKSRPEKQLLIDGDELPNNEEVIEPTYDRDDNERRCSA